MKHRIRSVGQRPLLSARAMAIAFVAVSLLSCSKGDGLTPEDRASAERARLAGEKEAQAEEAAKPKIDPGVMQPYRADYFSSAGGDPGWGKAGLARINKLRVDAANTVLLNPDCGRVEMSDLAEKASTPPNHPVVFVDCSSHYRFIISEADIGHPVSGRPVQGLQ